MKLAIQMNVKYNFTLSLMIPSHNLI